jgi:hypothetical protein
VPTLRKPLQRSARKRECDPNTTDCSTLVQVYTATEVDNALEALWKKYEREPSRLKATVDAQCEQIAELRKKAGLR